MALLQLRRRQHISQMDQSSNVIVIAKNTVCCCGSIGSRLILPETDEVVPIRDVMNREEDGEDDEVELGASCLR